VRFPPKAAISRLVGSADIKGRDGCVRAAEGTRKRLAFRSLIINYTSALARAREALWPHVSFPPKADIGGSTGARVMRQC
jgi:hypothetical protein